MGHERAIHPFFRKDLGPPADNAPSNTITPVSSSTDASVDSLDHDPNTTRRKRRKTERHKSPPSDTDALVESVSTVEPPASSEPDLPYAEPSTDPTSQPELKKRTPSPQQSPKRKTVKLNSNGKLLSSPVSKQPAEDEPKKKSRRRKSGKGENTKIVVFKYSKSEEGRFGKLVDDIIAGRRRHAPPKSTQPAPPVIKKEQPPKPTHPFFMKKPMRKPEVSSSPVAHDATANPAHESKTPSSTPIRQSPSGSFMKSFGSFRHRPLKVPDPVHPIWPPRGLCHVRGLDENAGLPKTYLDYPLELGPKKSKMAAVSVSDNESVLSPNTLNLNNESLPILRLPGRNTASGHVLQRAVTRQLSHNALSGSRKDTLSSTCHPAIVHLHSSIPRTMSAFDTGGFDSLLWAQKYAPRSVEQVLQVTKEVQMLRDWLKYLMISAVDTGKPSKDGEKKGSGKKKKKRRKSDKLDGFVVSSSEEDYQMDEVSDSEDELAGNVTVSAKRTVIRAGDAALGSKAGPERSRMSNAILVSGPPGCGKTASIYAVAKELDFEVFEINSGSRRNARDIVERVGDMTRNHLVHNFEEKLSQNSSLKPGAANEKQNKLMGFFKSTGNQESTKATECKNKGLEKESDQKRTRQQKQSFILLEEADILFEEDKQFWSGVLTLINQSKRPIIITCNDESRIPLDDISFHAILRFRSPPQHLAVDYLLLLAANEGHLLKREALNALYMGASKDLRKSITELNFWCQMAVGSEKSGLDWIIDRWPRGCDLDEEGNPLRVISLNTYEQFMGWFSRDMLLSGTLDSEIEPGRESLMWWQLSLQDGEDMSDVEGLAKTHPKVSVEQRMDDLRRFSDLMDSRSTLDLLSVGLSMDPNEDVLDTSIETISEKQRASYVEGYPLLTAELLPSYTSLSQGIGSTYATFLRHVFRPRQQKNIETTQAVKALAKGTQSKPPGPTHGDLLRAFAPIMKPNYVFPPPIGRVALSFENGLRPIVEDLGPYIRSIMAFDLRLEQHRLQLSGLLSQEGQGTKRMRTTRASRAALEGGNKAETRKERWFPADTNALLVLGTGQREWQEVLVQNGYFTLLVRSSSVVMSLFGTSPEESSSMGHSAQRSKSSLFADDPSLGGDGTGPNYGSSSLFADDDSGSPWNSNANKRTARHRLLKTLLADTEVPESYIDAYDLVLQVGDRVGSGVGLTAVREILSSSGLSATDQAKILNLVVSGDIDGSGGLGRGEFNVLLALVGLAQEGEDLTLDAVDDRRKKLPIPNSSYLQTLRARQESAAERPTTPPPPTTPQPEPPSAQSRRSGRDSMGGLEADPWGSPDLHRGHAHAATDAAPPLMNGFGSVRSTTNAWSGRTAEETKVHEASEGQRTNGHPDAGASSANAGFAWGESFAGAGGAGSLGGPLRAGLGGFGPPGGDPGDPNGPRRRSLGMARVASPPVEEVVTVTLLPEKEGMFMFQHRNYEVKCARRGSTVIRRYSDFVWLLDCLHKRYPFRQLPLLPPKRIAVNGTHLAADSTSFLEKRRRGLVRFTNALVRHPVLSQEQLVIMFLTVPTELSVWRKQATISVQDEFTGKALPPDLEDSLPATLTDTFETVRSGVRRSAEVYINLCTLLERLAKRNEGLAADHLRFSLALQSLTEMTRDTYAMDTNDVPLLNEGIKATARHLSASQSLLEDEARAWEAGMLEDLKRQRDTLVSVREMFDRRDRYARNNIPQLERRIEGHERKLQDLRQRPAGTMKPGEIEKVEEAIFKDKESIVQQHARGVFIRECVRDELVYFQQSQYHISRLHQDWSQERVKYSELQADNWRSLSDQVEGMPLGD
ncbi:hypothetical protein BDV59DRAFT_193779 [Aspergillus ambiguus]|uniref:sorting nexin Mvp1 n=1 Tax=Aspergillus ambiguus TaxID=176160 RepID=UPI003CCD38CD